MIGIRDNVADKVVAECVDEKAFCEGSREWSVGRVVPEEETFEMRLDAVGPDRILLFGEQFVDVDLAGRRCWFVGRILS